MIAPAGLEVCRLLAGKTEPGLQIRAVLAVGRFLARLAAGWLLPRLAVGLSVLPVLAVSQIQVLLQSF